VAAPLPFSESELRLLQVLLKRKVRFMVVGLSAATLQGAPVVTQDVDLWFENLGEPKISRALQEVGAAYATNNKVFSPQNWLKSKDSLTKIQACISMLINMVQNMPGGPELKASLTLKPELFGLRWSSD
jgi:hypothetical protein